MKNGIILNILGDFAPFSAVGKSIGYQVFVGESNFLIDCGAPLFQQIGSDGISQVSGLILTHCHDDHKRWFTDMCLFNRYFTKKPTKVSLITSEEVFRDLMDASKSSLDRSLSHDSESIVDIPLSDYISHITLGPRAKYRIHLQNNGNGSSQYMILDRCNEQVGPDQAKIIINPKTNRPRMLFKDPNYKEWVEPESFYPFSSPVFYEDNKNDLISKEGFRISALKAPVWHGLPAIGVVVTTDNESLIFSSDTAHNLPLWERLFRNKRKQNYKDARKSFEDASVIYDDINNYIERVWSEDRYKEAINSFNRGHVIHDISYCSSVVHTDYESLSETVLEADRTLLTHSPDNMTSEWILCTSDQSFLIHGNDCHEIIGDTLWPMNADVYHRENGKCFLGYKNPDGRYIVSEKMGILKITTGSVPHGAEEKYRVDLYEDIGGGYFPRLEKHNLHYNVRPDGKVELVEFSDSGSSGRVIESSRKKT